MAESESRRPVRENAPPRNQNRGDIYLSFRNKISFQYVSRAILLPNSVFAFFIENRKADNSRGAGA